MTIRLIADADIDQVATLIRDLAPGITRDDLRQRLTSVLAQVHHRVWVYEHDARVVGVLHAFTRPALEKPVEIVVQSIVVASGQRKSGVGRALMAEAEAWARATGCPSVALHTRNATPFYERLGYATVATPALMRKSLT